MKNRLFLPLFFGFFGLLFFLAFPFQAKADELALQSKVQNVIQKTLPSVFQITVQGGGQGEKFGSGFFINRGKGRLLTNYHVVAQGKRIRVRAKEQEKWSEVKVLHQDSRRDLALLELTEKGKLPKSIPFAPKTKKPQIGQFVIALGSPGGYEYSATLGIISSVSRELDDLNVNFGFIQVDAAMYHGSSGGPVVDLNGDLIAVTSRGGARGAAGFGVPAPVIRSFLDEYKDVKKTSPKTQETFAFLHALLQPLDDELRQVLPYDLEGGALVRYSASANVRPGDVLVKVGDLKIRGNSANQIQIALNEISGLGPGSHKTEIFRKGKKIVVNISLKEKPLCDPDLLETKKVSARVLKSGDRCAFFPKGEFLEISRYWHKGKRPSGLKKGDLLMKLDGHSKNIKKRFSQISESDKNQRVLGEVLRNHEPYLVVIQAKGVRTPAKKAAR